MLLSGIRIRHCLLAAALSFLSGATVTSGQNQPSAEDILKLAKSQASSQHKLVFLILGSSWCGPCHRLDRMLSAPEVRPILDKYFVIARMSVLEEKGKRPELNTPGGNQILEKLANRQSVPYFVFEDHEGKILVTSDRPVSGKPHGANIGYPDSPEEIAWFMTMLKTSVPSLSAGEFQTIDSWLRKASTR